MVPSMFSSIVAIISLALMCSSIESFSLNDSRNAPHKIISSTKSASRRSFIASSSALTVPVVFSNSFKASAIDLTEYQDGPNGLKYLVTKEGQGSKPQRAQKVKTSYTLYLNGFNEDGGQKIDSSKGIFGEKPFEFNVGTSAVIKGWDLSLLSMKEGEARRLVIPSTLGYGEKGAGGKIPGGATLYFEVELTELGKMPTLTPDQEKWLEEHPL